jgi:O-antigen ligase
LGGASGNDAGAIPHAILQTVAVAAILFALWSRPGSAYPPQAKAITWLVGVYLALVLVSLIPLPASMWQALPGREGISRGLQLLRIDDASLPLSLTPQRSMASILWLLPPVAMFLLTLQSSHEQRKRLPWVLIGMAVISIGLGAAQLLGGPASPLRPYEITNPDLPVGFFANGNHFGTMLLCSLPFAGYLAARSTAKGRQRSRRSSGLLLAVATSLFILVGIGTIGSLAAYGLAVPAAVASLLIYRRAAYGRITRGWAAAFAGIFVLFVALAVSGPLDQEKFATKFAEQPASRRDMAEITAKAATAFFPVGSGLGSFQDVYRTFDEPDRISFEYINHAHNDYVEIALELGLVGILLILGFVGWWVFVSVQVWRSDEEGANLARAGTVIIAVVLLHSIVDYPIRTSAIASLVAMGCAMMIRPWVHPKRARETQPSEEGGGLRHLQVD